MRGADDELFLDTEIVDLYNSGGGITHCGRCVRVDAAQNGASGEPCGPANAGAHQS